MMQSMLGFSDKTTMTHANVAAVSDCIQLVRKL